MATRTSYHKGKQSTRQGTGRAPAGNRMGAAPEPQVYHQELRLEAAERAPPLAQKSRTHGKEDGTPGECTHAQVPEDTTARPKPVAKDEMLTPTVKPMATIMLKPRCHRRTKTNVVIGQPRIVRVYMQ